MSSLLTNCPNSKQILVLDRHNQCNPGDSKNYKNTFVPSNINTFQLVR
jgi:hypothetical protein